MIRVELNDAGVMQALSGLQSALNDLTPAMQDIGDELVERVRANFSDSQDPWGNSWADLSPTTKAMNGGRRAGGEPLRDTGQLMNSITSIASANSVEVGSSDNAGKAAMHQFGGIISGRMFRGATVPARPFLPIRLGGIADLPQDWSDAVIDIINDQLLQAMP